MRRAALLLSLSLLGCDPQKLLGGGGDAGPGSAPGPTGAPAASAGPMVTIPAGAFRAGSPCGATPRITNEELEGVSISLGEFQMDTYPYPNDPTKPAKTGVTQAEAAGLCAAGGKRLCSELEWERACKGPNGTTFEYGAGYDGAKCASSPTLQTGARPACGSGFGVKDLHGLVFEWTSSPFGRGTSGNLVSVRGGGKTGAVLQARCANAQSRPTSASEPDLGFRCCAGPANAAEVNLTLDKQPPMVAEPSVEAGLAAAMLRPLPADHRTQANADVTFDRVWRWHPRANEEILLGRWKATPKDGTAPYFELAAFKVCGGVPALIGRMRGPVETMGQPGAGADPQRASVEVSIAPDTANVDIQYSYGSVRFNEPTWLKAGSTLTTGKKPRIPIIRPKKGG
jgi:sulfatase modifying factor 1